MRLRRPRTPAPRLAVRCDPVLRAGVPTGLSVETDAPGELRVFLRLLGWDRRRAQKWLLKERPVPAGTHAVEAHVPAGLAPGCARMTEYAVYAELEVADRRVAAATPVRLVGDTVWWPDGQRAGGEEVTLADEVVAIGGTLRGRAAGRAEVGAELHTSDAEPRFLPVATVEGDFALTLPDNVPPTLHDGEELGVSWAVRTENGWRRFAVVDPDGVAGERRPGLLTFLARLARDPFSLRG